MFNLLSLWGFYLMGWSSPVVSSSVTEWRLNLYSLVYEEGHLQNYLSMEKDFPKVHAFLEEFIDQHEPKSLEGWQEKLSDVIQDEFEHGVKWLNEQAHDKFCRAHPVFSKFLDELNFAE